MVVCFGFCSFAIATKQQRKEFKTNVLIYVLKYSGTATFVCFLRLLPHFIHFGVCCECVRPTIDQLIIMMMMSAIGSSRAQQSPDPPPTLPASR